jgi:hypothetical protein
VYSSKMSNHIKYSDTLNVVDHFESSKRLKALSVLNTASRHAYDMSPYRFD